MKSWNVFSGDWSRMRYEMNQNLWGNGTGGSKLIGMQTVDAFASKKKKAKKKKFKNGIPDGLENDAQQMELDLSEAEMQENPVQSGAQDTKKNLLEQQTAAMKAGSLKEETATDGLQMKDPAALQEAILWAEILGEPVSMKRRKRRVNQYYGNQGNAYRR